MAITPTASSHDSTPLHRHGEVPYGSRLLPQVVDELARSNPGRIYATIALSSNLSQGFRDVTMLQVSRAVNKSAYWIEHILGRSTMFETLSYMGLPDLRYAVIFLAAIKCGYKLLVPSVRNSTWMNVSLLEQTKCSKFLYADELSQKIHDLQTQKKDLQTFAVQSLNDMLQDYDEHYPYEKKFQDVRLDPVLVLHSSGSTGPPKPIQTNHATWAVIDNDRNLPIVIGRKNQSFDLWNFEGDGGRYFAAFPPFHLGGFVALIALPIYSTTATVVLGPADRPPAGRLLSEIMDHSNLRALFCPPTIFEQLVVEPKALEQVRRLDFLLYGGGPLSTTTGNLLSELTDVCQFYGSTETGPIPALVPLREDWATLEWHPSYQADMQHFEDDAYEMVLHRDPKLEGIRGLSCNFPDAEEWHTRDLFRPHPTKPNLWRFYGRTDDIIVLSNGEKFNPLPSEAIIAEHDLLSGAVIVGLARFQPALLVEVRDKCDLRPEAVVESIWPIIEKANTQAPGHARIIRSMIAVAGGTKRFERAGKGTIIRKMTADKFAPEIDALYSEANSGGLGPVLTSSSLSAIQEYVRASIGLSFPVPDLRDDDDLYVLGLDSLKSVEIAGILKAGILKASIESSDISWLSTQTVYANPTIQKLSKLIHIWLSPQGMSEEERTGSEEIRITRMASLVHRYTEDLPQVSSKGKNQLLEISKLNVALTGSTGSLGTHLLQALLGDPTIKKIYCLNRSARGRERQEENFASLDVKRNLDPPRVEFIKVNYGENQLGLPDEQFNEMTSTVDLIIHNAWKVDFNHSVESFEPVHIRGVRKLIDWSLHSSRHPHIFFISSLSSVGNWRSVGHENPVPEVHISSHLAAQETGYGESKHVSECILNAASERSGVPVSVLRVGQIAGPVAPETISAAGVWNRNEWFPSLIKTSLSLGYLPDYVPEADWIPVDSLAACILDIGHFATKKDKSWTYNIVNPQPTAWMSLLDTIVQRLGPQVQIVELSKWTQMLEQIDQNSTRELIAKPAAKILEFYRAFEGRRKAGGLSYCTANGIAASKTIAELQPVSKDWMEIWLTQWGY